MTRIPSLDGLRALAIGAVIVAHLSHALPPNLRSVLEPAGFFGVRIFFVISGFLITSLILREIDKSGTFSVKAFYVRRCFRILPPLCFYLLAVFFLSQAGLVSSRPSDFLRALLYVVNYGDWPSSSIGHLWSLSVEEQFYLVWPLIFAFVPRRMVRVIPIVLIGLSCIARFQMASSPDLNQDRAVYHFQFAGAIIAYGCCLAIFAPQLETQSWYLSFCNSKLGILLLIALLLAHAVLKRFGPSGSVISEVLSNISIVGLIARVTSNPSDWIGRIFNWRAVVYVGTVSFSVYLWQQLFLPAGVISGPLGELPESLLATAVCALLSYYLIEKPFQAAGRWVSTRSAASFPAGTERSKMAIH